MVTLETVYLSIPEFSYSKKQGNFFGGYTYILHFCLLGKCYEKEFIPQTVACF